MTINDPLRRAVTASSVLVALLLVGAAACAAKQQPKETVESLRQNSPTLQAIARNAKIRIAVRQDVPYMFYLDPKNPGARRTGFEIEIARAMATELGFGEDLIEWVPIKTMPERLTVLQQNRADLVVANFSMTEEREKFVDFAGPYQLVPQAVLVRRGRSRPIVTLEDLQGDDMRVCTTTGSTAVAVLKANEIKPRAVDTHLLCIDGLRSGAYDAFTGDLPILAALAEAERSRTGTEIFEVLDLAIADQPEKIGVASPNNDEAMRKVISWYLHKWQTAGANSRWQLAYDRTIGPYLDEAYRSQPLVDNWPDLADYDAKAPR